MKVIGLCGYAGSGKDTAAEALVEQGWLRVAFADPIREMALAIDPYVSASTDGTCVVTKHRLSWVLDYVGGWQKAQTWPEVRRLLQRIGTEAGREILGKNIWIQLAYAAMTEASISDDPPAGIVITDLRFKNEYEWLKLVHAIIVRISRPGIGPVNDHQSDRYLANFQVDAEIVNDGSKAKLWSEIRAIANHQEPQ